MQRTIFSPSGATRGDLRPFVHRNGMNMESKFSSYKWKVTCFPSNITQRCVLRMRTHNGYILLLHKKKNAFDCQLLHSYLPIHFLLFFNQRITQITEGRRSFSPSVSIILVRISCKLICDILIYIFADTTSRGLMKSHVISQPKTTQSKAFSSSSINYL